MKPIDYLLLAAVIVLVLLALRAARSRTKNGCCGGSGSCSCGGNCAGCSGCSLSAGKGVTHKDASLKDTTLKEKAASSALASRNVSCPHCSSARPNLKNKGT